MGFMTDEVAPCVTGNTCIYSFKGDRVLIGEEHGNLMGFGAAPIREAVYKGAGVCSDKENRDLFSDSMAVPQIAAVLISVVLQLDDCFPKKAGSGASSSKA